MVERTMFFLFDKNQSYTESNYCENKEKLQDRLTREFEREIKNDVTFSVNMNTCQKIP